jgi:fluoride exporter
MKRLLLLALAGSIGTLARYGLSGLVQRHAGALFPWGTFAVNALGCFLFGLVWTLAERRMWISPEYRIVILVGFMGAFTTFSTYAFETTQQLQDAQWGAALGNIVLNNVLGIALVYLGLSLGKTL